ncbi:DUF262 domain-containing protein [Anaerovorax odorimutans]|uniref:DUF262 domain-containing protein n=1 Tax=Anaerovorax odorimutans TaxID=109327 RepID=UPI002E8DE036|nr:DUF262 domain-containing protein [Anaerovorax odorimutans]
MNDTGDNRFRIRLKQTSYDSRSFMSIIDDTPIENDDNNVTKNYNYFKKLISNCDVNAKEIYETIPKLEVVDVNLQIENDLGAIQTVFEKINSTGKRLTAADLIRNFLLLANNSFEQERLYEDYWVKIEKRIKNQNISRFSRDYLILNIFEDVPDSNIYKMFKDHFNSTGALHIDILRDMYKYSKYYEWLKFENCPIDKINKLIKVLNYVKSDDVYPLYLYLFDTHYESDKPELIKILTLLSDFMLRYRIVSPSGGGGALRSVVQQLLEGLNSGIIENNYQSILFELSNSNAPSGRFPTDDEFIEALTNSVNTNYAKVVLLKIEESERSNIPIPLEQVTIEHIMPQTLNDWWIENLGGQENAERIHEKYLNCIGNLAPISQSYNSKISNKSWDIKQSNLKDVQFIITSEIVDNIAWKENEITKKNNRLAKRACKAITSPLARTRKYQTKNTTSEFEAGIYPISDITTPMSGTVLEYVIYESRNIEVSTWKDFIAEICKIAYEIDCELFKKIVRDNKIHKATSKNNYPEKDPIITQVSTLLLEAKPIGETGYFSEGVISSNRARVYAKQLMDLYGVTDRIQISVHER